MSTESVLRGITDKDTKALVRKALKAGCTVEVTNNQHIEITTPSGARIRTGLTSSARNAVHHLRADLRRAGVLL